MQRQPVRALRRGDSHRPVESGRPFAVYASSSISPLRARMPVQAGLTYEIRVAGGWSPAREFEFISVLR
jgi:hypothetical protein